MQSTTMLAARGLRRREFLAVQAEEAAADAAAAEEGEEEEEMGGLGSLFEEGPAGEGQGEEDDDLIHSEDEPQPLEDLCALPQQAAAQEATLLVHPLHFFPLHGLPTVLVGGQTTSTEVKVHTRMHQVQSRAQHAEQEGAGDCQSVSAHAWALLSGVPGRVLRARGHHMGVPRGGSRKAAAAAERVPGCGRAFIRRAAHARAARAPAGGPATAQVRGRLYTSFVLLAISKFKASRDYCGSSP
jgi:hypothetical protein